MPTRSPAPASIVERTDEFLRDITATLQRIESRVVTLFELTRRALEARQPRRVRRAFIPVPSRN